jgi:hypothetical protein
LVYEHRSLPKKTCLPILATWNAKEDLMDLLELHGTHPDRVATSTRRKDRQ